MIQFEHKCSKVNNIVNIIDAVSVKIDSLAIISKTIQRTPENT